MLNNSAIIQCNNSKFGNNYCSAEMQKFYIYNFCTVQKFQKQFLHSAKCMGEKLGDIISWVSAQGKQLHIETVN